MMNVTLFVTLVSTMVYVSLILAFTLFKVSYTTEEKKVNEHNTSVASRVLEGLTSIVKYFKDHKSSSTVYVIDKEENDDIDGWLTNDILESNEIKTQKDKDNSSMTTYDSTLLQEPSLELSTATSSTPVPATMLSDHRGTVDVSDNPENTVMTVDKKFEDRQAEILSRDMESSRIVLPALVKPLPPSRSSTQRQDHGKHRGRNFSRRSSREQSRDARRSSRRGRRERDFIHRDNDIQDSYYSTEDANSDRVDDLDVRDTRQKSSSSKRGSSRGYERSSSREMKRSRSRGSSRHKIYSRPDDVSIQDVRNPNSMTREKEIDSKFLGGIQNLSISTSDNKGGGTEVF